MYFMPLSGIQQGQKVFLDYVLSLLFLLTQIVMSGWCYNMNSKSLMMIAGRLMADDALLLCYINKASTHRGNSIITLIIVVI